MTVIGILVLGSGVGFVVGRWLSIGLGLAVGVLALGAVTVTTGWPADTPAIFVAVVAALAAALGVSVRQLVGLRSA